jgi:FkbM family methyltransferase
MFSLNKKLANHFLKRVSHDELSELMLKFGGRYDVDSETKNTMELIDVAGVTFSVSAHWFWEEYRKSGWEPETYETFRRNLTDDTIYVDIGAWVGITLMWARVLGVKKIHAVEANPESYELLSRTVMENQLLEPCVDLTNACVTNKDNELVRFGRGLSSASRIAKDGDYSVLTTRLSSYLNKNGLSGNLFIKIDIEGAECLVIEDLANYLALGNKAFLALHPPFWEDKVASHDLIIESLKEFCLFNARGETLEIKELSKMILSEEKYPAWGTSFGNLFEILVTPKD